MNRGGGKRAALLILCLAGAILFTGLGVWQMERRQWKLALIERVESRIHATPMAAPPRLAWAGFDAKAEEYRRVRVRGEFLHDRETMVDALTERGPGFWALTPLRTADGIVLINRGFVPSRQAPSILPEGDVAVTGLLRPSEPGGRFLRPNRPGEDRWYSRDVAAIAAARGLTGVAPFFIDAERASHPGFPVGGMTVVEFRNTHLIYALTWFGLATLSVWGLVLLRKPGQASA